MTPRDRLVWGLVGAFGFLVLVQGYELAAPARVGLVPKGLVALAVGVVTVALVEPVERLAGGNGSA